VAPAFVVSKTLPDSPAAMATEALAADTAHKLAVVPLDADVQVLPLLLE